MASRIQIRRDTAANWTSSDPTLVVGEPGFETDTGYFKIGDGSTAWSSLLYAVGVGLTAIEALAKTDGNIIVGNGSTWVAESGATARTSLGLTIGTNVLAYDAGIQNLAGVAMAADKFYYTSADNVHVAGDVTAFARSILDDANEAAFKATVNLEIGTDVQAFGAVLDDFNTLGANSADGEFLVGTGAGALAWESGATLRTSIGVGTGDSLTLTGITVDSTTLHVDSGNHRVGIGTITPTSPLHIYKGESGQTADAVSAFVVESNSSAVISLLAPSNTAMSIYFGTEVDNGRGKIIYDAINDMLRFDIAGGAKAYLSNTGSILLKEGAAADGDIAAFGQIWIKNDTPNILKFTDDAGSDFNVVLSDGSTGGTGSAGSGNQYIEINVGGTTYKVLHDGTV